MAEPKVKAKNPCGCDISACHKKKGETCYDANCMLCEACCPPECPFCEKKCKPGTDGKKCECYNCICGCQEEDKKKKKCSESGCKRCVVRCKDLQAGDRCSCYLCNCGDHCDGVNCQCCKWCNPYSRCPGEGQCDRDDTHDEKECPKGVCGVNPGGCTELICKCDGTTGARKPSGPCPCKCTCKGTCPRIKCHRAKCTKSVHGDACTNLYCESSKTIGKCVCVCECSCNVIGYYFDKEGNPVDIIDKKGHAYAYLGRRCRFKCKNCGKLCSQDAFRRGCYIGVPILLVSVAIVFVCRLYPDPFRKVFYQLSATFAKSFKSSGASTNLAGGRIHEEMDTDEYSAFPFKGLM
ncbi:hypothetical protein, conserved [Babesia ovata]|uniref:Uncharacterized protein n=1 Tax=Babesia ovata TaxID=189622 RepID=A0A2H6KAG9_9APIC|nr:uncharacterized protein BOVATA_014420 [Babesia ovata]GBE59949.1 hypothetical protein, conserved [Babesia ovata]